MSQAGKPIYLIANWKSQKTWAETEVFLQQFRGFREEGNVINVICPPFPYLKTAAEMVTGLHLPLKLGAQDISPFPFGAYTGAVAAEMVAPLVTYTILGHSERRRYFHETNQEVANKVARAIENQLTPIVCVDEPYLEAQMAAIEPNNLAKIIVAYEPLTAIGSGLPDTPEHAQEIALKINEVMKQTVPVLYGGSVTAENIKRFLGQPLIQGALVGGASLTIDSWKALLHASV